MQKQQSRQPFHYGEDGMTIGAALLLARGRQRGILSPAILKKVQDNRQMVEHIVHQKKRVYGINTGFGPLCTTLINEEDTKKLQYNLLMSHSVGVGQPISREMAKLMLILKVHALAKGYSGITVETLQRLIWHIDQEVIPCVPEQGSVGASGDLAPLAHLFLPLIGLGKLWQGDEIKPAAEVLQHLGMPPIELGPKEGLALINGTQFMAAHAIAIVERLQNCLDHADILAAINLEAMMGSVKSFDAALHALRPHSGSVYVAGRMRELLKDSEIVESHCNCTRVQDPYSLRCIPQVHGASRNAWLHLKETTLTEINAVTDNPIIFSEDKTISGGLFHGQPIALPLDYAGLAAAELGNISDRRIYLSMTESVPGLPKLLMTHTGLNSGFMILQYTTAALVSENKSLCFPASADSIPTSLGQEDHVSMGSISGRKTLQMVANLEKILAIELITAAQGFDFRKPLKSGFLIEEAHQLIRSHISFTENDRVFDEDIAYALELIRSKGLIQHLNEKARQEISTLKTSIMTYSEFIETYARHPVYRAPTGSQLHAKSWQTEAPLRMLLNNLHAEVAEDPANLIVYGGTGQAARNPEAMKEIIRILLEMDEHHSLLVQSGKPIGLVRSHPSAPRVLIANSNLVPAWANWSHFEALKARGLMMYGQMTAGSWIYIGSQGILQGTWETFVACGKKYFNGDLKHRLIVSGGLGGMGGAQPLAATMAGACFLGVDVDPERIQKRLQTKYIDRMTADYEEAKHWVLAARKKGEALSVGLVGDIGDVLERLLRDNLTPDILTDQTSAHDPLNGYVPNGLSLEEALELRKNNPENYKERSLRSMARHVGYMLQLKERGSVTFDYGNNLREFARQGGETRAFDYHGFIPEFIRPLFCEGQGPFRWVALSGDPEDIYTTDQALMELFHDNAHLLHWLTEARKKVVFQGLPSRICWLGMGDREKAGLCFNELVKSGRVKAPIVIGRDHLDCGSVASPNRETEAMMDGSDAVSDWPLLNLMANTSGGATWVSFHHGGGVGMGYSQHAGMVVLADGSDRAGKCLSQVLYNDPAMGIFRHADAGYPTAIENRKRFNI